MTSCSVAPVDRLPASAKTHYRLLPSSCGTSWDKRAVLFTFHLLDAMRTETSKTKSVTNYFAPTKFVCNIAQTDLDRNNTLITFYANSYGNHWISPVNDMCHKITCVIDYSAPAVISRQTEYYYTRWTTPGNISGLTSGYPVHRGKTVSWNMR